MTSSGVSGGVTTSSVPEQSGGRYRYLPIKYDFGIPLLVIK